MNTTDLSNNPFVKSDSSLNEIAEFDKESNKETRPLSNFILDDLNKEPDNEKKSDNNIHFLDLVSKTSSFPITKPHFDVNILKLKPLHKPDSSESSVIKEQISFNQSCDRIDYPLYENDDNYDKLDSSPLSAFLNSNDLNDSQNSDVSQEIISDVINESNEENKLNNDSDNLIIKTELAFNLSPEKLENIELAQNQPKSLNSSCIDYQDHIYFSEKRINSFSDNQEIQDDKNNLNNQIGEQNILMSENNTNFNNNLTQKTIRYIDNNKYLQKKPNSKFFLFRTFVLLYSKTK